MLDLDPTTFARAYNGIANSMLWFAHHMLCRTPPEPVFDHASVREWVAYTAYNQGFADAVAEEAAEGARVLVQDYHLTLVPAMLRALRPDLRIGHFSHTPWASARLLPACCPRPWPARCSGHARRRPVGFLTRRWAEAFARCCADVLGAAVTARSEDGPMSVQHDGRVVRIDVNPLGVDVPGLQARAAERDVEVRLAALRDQLGGLQGARAGRPDRAVQEHRPRAARLP